jgi:hypothetical protein
MRGPLEEQLQRARADHERDDDEDTARELNEREYQLRLLRLMRARLDMPGDETRVTFVGPSAMVLDAVWATMRNVATALSELAQSLRDDRLRRTAAAALAGVDTFVACRAVTSFDFDGDADQGRQW